MTDLNKESRHKTTVHQILSIEWPTKRRAEKLLQIHLYNTYPDVVRISN